MVPSKQRIIRLKSDLLQTFPRRLEDDGIAELIELAEIDSPATGKQLLVQCNRVGLSTNEIERQMRDRQPAINSSGFFCPSASEGSSSDRAVERCVKVSRRPANTSPPTETPSACMGAGDE